jgi:predicted esterase
MPHAQAIAVTTHGRYLVEAPPAGRPCGVVIGFHGYGESADVELERLKSIPGSSRWTLVSVQGLHRFYRGRSNDVVASWMTRQDRELAIADNAGYVSAVVAAVVGETHVQLPLVFSGFSQGVAMAFRSACSSSIQVAAVIAAGGDIPPELTDHELGRIPVALLARGSSDEWYTAAKWEADQERLRVARVERRAVGFEGAHEWNEDVSREAGALLERLTR